MKCIKCGCYINLNFSHIRYFVSPPNYIIYPHGYYLCDEHKDLSYSFEDIYEEIKEDGKIKFKIKEGIYIE